LSEAIMTTSFDSAPVTPASLLLEHGYAAELSSALWLRVTRRTLPGAGWKLHITATPARYLSLLRAVLPLLRDAAAFKVAASVEALEDLNDARYGIAQAGKAITVYTCSEAEAHLLGTALHAALGEFEGPPVVTDSGYWGNDGPVFYRYGSFDGAYRVNELGRKIRIVRLPGETIADDVPGVRHLPPSQLPVVPDIDTLAFLRDRYLFVQVLHLSAKGAVLAALDKAAPRAGVQLIKTARRHAQADPFGRDALWALRREADLGTALAAMPGATMHGTLIESPDGKAAALVRPYIDGEPFAIRWQSPDARRHASRMQQTQILRDASTTLQALHQAGYVFRDFSPANLLVSDTGVYLLDYELAHALDDPAPPYRRGTRGFYDSRRERFAAPTQADDYYALLAWSLLLHAGVHPEWLAPETILAEDPSPVPHDAYAAAHAEAARTIHRPADFWPTYDNLLEVTPGLPTPSPPTSLDRSAIEAELSSYLKQWVEATPHPWISLDRASVFGGLSGVLLAIVDQEPQLLASALGDPVMRAKVLTRLDAAARELAHIPGFYFGSPGIGVALIQAGTHLQDSDWIDRGAQLLEQAAWPLPLIPDLCHGLAGYVAAQCEAAVVTADSTHLAAALNAASLLLPMQSPEGAWPWPVGPHTGLSGEKQYGMAHGAAGVVWALTGLHEATGDDSLLPAVHAGVRLLLNGARALETDDGRPALWWPVSESDDRCWNAWSHGTPGVAIALARAAAVCEAARESLLPAALGITLANNTGYCLCHGIASRLEAYTAVLQVQRDAAIEAEARRDAVLLAGLPLAALEARANPEAGDDGYGLMKGAAGVWRALLRWQRLEELLQHQRLR